MHVSFLSRGLAWWIGEEMDKYRTVRIDEAQFIPDLVSFCVAVADEHNKKVVVAGLDGDFKRGRFGEILDLLPLCDSVTKLTAQCEYVVAARTFFAADNIGGEHARTGRGFRCVQTGMSMCYLKNATYLSS